MCSHEESYIHVDVGKFNSILSRVMSLQFPPAFCCFPVIFKYLCVCVFFFFLMLCCCVLSLQLLLAGGSVLYKLLHHYQYWDSSSYSLLISLWHVLSSWKFLCFSSVIKCYKYFEETLQLLILQIKIQT